MPNLLRCKIEDCHVLQHTVASPGVSEGVMGLMEDTVYAWLEDYDTGDLGVKIIEAERIMLPKESAAAFDAGDYVYYDDATHTLNTTDSGRYRCGICRVDAAALTTEVEVDFWGHDAVVVA